MNRGAWRELVDQLRGAHYQFGLIEPGSPVHHVEFDAGLTDAEIVGVECKFTFFPDGESCRRQVASNNHVHIAVPGLSALNQSAHDHRVRAR
jgi:hypothetical protein